MNQAIVATFVAQIESQVPDVRQRSRVASAAIALAIVHCRHLPTAPVMNPSAHYMEHIYPSASTLISRFNEDVIIDTQECEAMVRSFWLLRYRAAFPEVLPVSNETYSFFETLFGVNMLVPENITAFVNDPTNRSQIFALMSFASQCIEKETY